MKNIIFVEGEDDSKVWYEIIKKDKNDKKYLIISGGGTNLIQNFYDVEFVLNVIKNKNEKINYFGLFDYDAQGLEYKRILNSENSMTKCYTLKSLNLSYTNNYNTIEIEDILYNSKLGKWVKVNYFLKDYNNNPNDYLIAKNAWIKLKKIIDQYN